MIAPHPTRARYRDCGCPALPPFQHKCNKQGGPLAGRKSDTAERLTPTQGRATTHRAGKAAEDALCAALVAAGFCVQTYAAWLRTAVFTGAWSRDIVREFPVGLLLEPVRGFRADLFHPASRTVCEVEGQVHSIKGRRKADILREQLLNAAGLRVVRVLPEQCKTGEVVELVSRAIGAKE